MSAKANQLNNKIILVIKRVSFGFALLDRGASSINMPSFKYYDRMYPSQDVLSKLGNLVAVGAEVGSQVILEVASLAAVA